MNGKIVTVLFALIFCSLCAFAQSPLVIEKTGGFARVQAMGANPYVIDPIFMTINPAWGAYYDNFIFGDLGTTQTPFGNNGGGQFIGANLRVSKQLTIGAILTRNDFNSALSFDSVGVYSISHLDPANLFGELNDLAGFNVFNIDNNLEIMASFKNGPHKLGIGLAYAGSSIENNPAGSPSSDLSITQIGINIGYVGNMIRNLLLDVGFSISFPSVSVTSADGSEASLSQTNIGLTGRGFFNLSQKFKFVPALTFQSSTGTGDATVSGQTAEGDLDSKTLLSLGGGFIYQSGDFLFAGGPSIIYFSTTTPGEDSIPELTNSTTYFPTWNIGAEWTMLEWLVARLGYVSYTGSRSIETTNFNSSVDETNFTVYGQTGAFVGLGFRLGNLSIDGTVNTDVLRQGLNNIGGGGATFARLSVSLTFDE